MTLSATQPGRQRQGTTERQTVGVEGSASWTTGRGLSRQLTVPLIPRQEPAGLLDDDERWQLLQRCLTDAALPIQARAAGALILLFALQAQRIRHLTVEELRRKGDDTYLTAGQVEDRDQELHAARAANRELITQLNTTSGNPR